MKIIRTAKNGNSVIQPFARSMPYVAKKEAEDKGMIKESASSEQDIKTLKKDLKDMDKKIKTMDKDLKKFFGVIGNLNIGHRRYWQQQTVFTSLQRKLERLEQVEKEWKKYKKEMDAKVKKLVEQRTRAGAGSGK